VLLRKLAGGALRVSPFRRGRSRGSAGPAGSLASPPPVACLPVHATPEDAASPLGRDCCRADGRSPAAGGAARRRLRPVVSTGPQRILVPPLLVDAGARDRSRSQTERMADPGGCDPRERTGAAAVFSRTLCGNPPC